MSGKQRVIAETEINGLESQKKILKFENHINKICKKGSQKLSALTRISPYIALDKKRTIKRAFVT